MPSKPSSNHSNVRKSGHSRNPASSHSRNPAKVHAKTPATIDPGVEISQKTPNDKINLVIQIPGEKDVLKVKLPKKTSIGEIKKYLNEKYGEDGKYLFISQLKSNSDSESKTSSKSSHNIKSKTPTNEKVGVIVKSSVGDEGEEVKFKIRKDMKVKNLKAALAKKFGLSADDFELMLISNKTPI